MKKQTLKAILAASLIVTGFVGCGPETVVAVAGVTQAATAVGAVAGTVWAIKSIENVSVDTEKKRLEIDAYQRGN